MPKMNMRKYLVCSGRLTLVLLLSMSVSIAPALAGGSRSCDEAGAEVDRRIASLHAREAALRDTISGLRNYLDGPDGCRAGVAAFIRTVVQSALNAYNRAVGSGDRDRINAAAAALDTANEQARLRDAFCNDIARRLDEYTQLANEIGPNGSSMSAPAKGFGARQRDLASMEFTDLCALASALLDYASQDCGATRGGSLYPPSASAYVSTGPSGTLHQNAATTGPVIGVRVTVGARNLGSQRVQAQGCNAVRGRYGNNINSLSTRPELLPINDNSDISEYYSSTTGIYFVTLIPPLVTSSGAGGRH